MRASKQLKILKTTKSDYGGDLLRTRAGRRHGRPVSTRETMHLVLRSTKARGDWSFLRDKNNFAVRQIIAKFAAKYGVRVLSNANAGNHLHLQIKLTNRFSYPSFIRAITGAIAMSISGCSHWKNAKSGENLATKSLARNDQPSNKAPAKREKFWDARPFTRIAKSFAEFRNLREYVRLNEVEAMGFSRREARELVETERLL